MINFIVIGICILLLLLVVYIAAKPISMGIEARRNLSDKNNVNEIYNIIQLKLLNLLHNFALTGSLGHEKLLVLHWLKKPKNINIPEIINIYSL